MANNNVNSILFLRIRVTLCGYKQEVHVFRSKLQTVCVVESFPKAIYWNKNLFLAEYLYMRYQCAPPRISDRNCACVCVCFKILIKQRQTRKRVDKWFAEILERKKNKSLILQNADFNLAIKASAITIWKKKLELTAKYVVDERIDLSHFVFVDEINRNWRSMK